MSGDQAPAWAVRLESKVDTLQVEFGKLATSFAVHQATSADTHRRVESLEGAVAILASKERVKSVEERVDRLEDSVNVTRGWLAGAVAASGLGGTALGGWLLQQLGGAQ